MKQFQNGSLRLRRRIRGPEIWEYRYRETGPDGRRTLKSVRVGTILEFPTEIAARRKVQSLVLSVNPITASPQDTTFGGLVDRYMAEEHLDEIIAGTRFDSGLRYSTAYNYRITLRKYIRPKWKNMETRTVRAGVVQEWLNTLVMSPKYKSNLKGLMHRLFEKAMLWEYLDYQRNPMDLVEIRGATHRTRVPRVLTPEEFCNVLALLSEPEHTMALVAQYTGLRISELVGLQWNDFDFNRLTFTVQRAVVDGHIDRVKTEASRDELPLSQELAGILESWKAQCASTSEGWLFANPNTGKPYCSSKLGSYGFKKIFRELGIRIGWHSFRHTYRSWLDATGVPIGVQQKLMRHAQVSTTMNIYGNALMESKREANNKIGILLASDRSKTSP